MAGQSSFLTRAEATRLAKATGKQIGKPDAPTKTDLGHQIGKAEIHRKKY